MTDFLDLHMENKDGKLLTSVYHKPFDAYLDERAKLRMDLLLNKYPGQFIDQQFNRVLFKFRINESPSTHNYKLYRKNIINSPIQVKIPVDDNKAIFVHFTYCSNMKVFPVKFHKLWQKYFMESPINDIVPILGIRNINNLRRRLVHTRHKAIH